jgi:hypothetical protein
VTRRLARTKRWTVVAAFVPLIFGATTIAAGASTLGAPATITNPNGTPRASGGSETVFAVALPQDATCPGLSHDGFHVYSYLVPAGTDVTSVTFAPAGPSTGFGLIDAPTSSYYGPVNTESLTGRILALPTFEWARILGDNGGAPTLTDLLYSGSNGMWDGGLACVDPTGHVTDSWNFQVMLSKSHSDANGFTWCVVPGVPAQAPEVPFALALPLVGLVVVGGFAVARRRRADRSRQEELNARP